MVFYLCSRLSPSAVVDGYHPSGVPENERVTLSPSGYRAFLQFQDGFHMELLKAVMPLKHLPHLVTGSLVATLSVPMRMKGWPGCLTHGTIFSPSQTWQRGICGMYVQSALRCMTRGRLV